MAFDQSTRNRLQRFVSEARSLLTEEFTRQLQQEYGMDPRTGEVSDLVKLGHLDDARLEKARLLRQIFAHYLESDKASSGATAKGVLNRIVREQAFTILNRLAALRMAETRGLLIESVGHGYQAKGFQLYARLGNTGLGETGDAYRVYLFSVFDELSRDLPGLFDRYSPQGCLFPREAALLPLLALINDVNIDPIWGEDETIGWIYQYFNPPEERKEMREASSAPRNSRELSVRNQFFTPRYVVEFLTDNTLGRIWYEMCKGSTILKEECRYLVRHPNEVFLAAGEKAADDLENGSTSSQDELPKAPIYISERPKKDPRDLHVLDPACGSGHFLLYAFDLLERMYEEAWEDPASPKSKMTGRALREEFETRDDLRRAVPKLIVEHNLYGVDIDARAVQIAALALWLRAQKAWTNLNLKATARPQIARSNIVTAEPMPGEEDMRREFTADLKPRVLGQLVDVVFDKMQLAGEAGSLLKIDEEITASVAEARRQWLKGPKPEQSVLFPELLTRKPEQGKLFDVAEITADEFWGQAEDRILGALKGYTERVDNGHAVRRRLFAGDAARGFAFIDICRRYYDVVLMNPPFGEFSRPYKAQSRIAYPNSYNDILGAFVERWLHRLEHRGRLGAITSRTCFFLASFTNWREKVILEEAGLGVVADLGQGVMDNAMVEAAAYTLERSGPAAMTPFIRAIAERDCEAIVRDSIAAINSATSESHLHLTQQDTFRKLANTPFVYWAEPDDLDRFAALPTLEPEAAEVRQGLSTGDDTRFVRAVWEVAPQDTQFVYYPADGETYCRLDDPIVLAYRGRQHAGTPRWAFHVKSGTSQPWYSPITVKVDWHQDGLQLRNFRDADGKPHSVARNMAYYYRPGFSWTRRAARFYPYVVPGNCLPSASRYMAFPKHGREYDVMGVSASRIASAFMRFHAEFWQRPNFLVENLKVLPWPELKEDAQQFFRELVQREVEQRRRAYMNHEPFHEFLLPIKVRDFSGGGRALAFDAKTLLGEEGERLVAKAYGFDHTASKRIERDVIEALEFQHGISGSSEDPTAANQDTNENRDFLLDYSERAQFEALISYCIGCIFGRWDVRISMDPSLAPKLPGPFDPLPICPPGMLVDPDGLPAEPGRIVSEEWLRARPNAGTVPPDGLVDNSTVPDDHYPLRISWDAILVDDPGFSGAQPHRDDIVRRIREALELLWQDKAYEIEQKASEILGVSDLRDYFRRLAGFFEDHLKRYSKSRRKAPIYWPLSTTSGSYTVWFYYHRMTGQTLYAAINDFVGPKLKQVSGEVAALRNKGATRSRVDEKQFEALRVFEAELAELHGSLLQIAQEYRPNHDDGVQISAAPLWPLFRHKPWQKVLKGTWAKLEKGQYDWAHLTMNYWPDRVREKCKTDQSIAIAHGLEDPYVEPEGKHRKKRKEKGNET